MLHFVDFAEPSLAQDLQNVELVFGEDEGGGLAVGQQVDAVPVPLSVEHVGEQGETVDGSFGGVVAGLFAGRSKGHSFFDFVLKDYIRVFFFGSGSVLLFGGVLLFGFVIDRSAFGSCCAKSTRVFFMVVRPFHL